LSAGSVVNEMIFTGFRDL